MRIVRGMVGLLGELFVTVGIVLLLFVAWQLWWTDVVSDADANQAVVALETRFEETNVHPAEVELGDAYAIVRIPRFGEDFARPLYEGTSREILQRGIGHYPDSVQPGEVGNFSMAGHRTTYGKPFSLIADLVPGDTVIVETSDTYVVYEVTEHRIVKPSDVWVVYPVPGEPNTRPTEALLTMTSCHPQFSSRERYVQHGVLVGTFTRAEGLPPELLKVS